MQSGSHIKVWRGRYYHHGIYVGGNQVVHYKSYKESHNNKNPV